mmetsp:Transcript_8555/g.15457  ORF Transcript_8555/g.15457 Transcript_8555/m.15457 type:complete len:288 (-) Transcript_8555:93-956(-)|eukprot:CAMPEP_0177755628 /NCGR_PEP_ID=MMETSP0491_2-20121128/2666_1 /TAXON_ID=63592 /ORGANISM="Tetraselmis chuii, Strain PLY429" /LENGTH=287 /DNA_ID=CAMNT_0019271135 /DNA_START=242 /DNA_END=1105 /DNA_ORIENTATION=-
MLRQALGRVVAGAAAARSKTAAVSCRGLASSLPAADAGSSGDVFARLLGSGDYKNPYMAPGVEVPPLPKTTVDGREVPYIPEYTGQWTDTFLECLRHSNQTMPLHGQVIVGRVLSVDRKSVLVHTGFKMPQRFMRKELSPQCLVSRANGAAPNPNSDGNLEFMPGDVLNLVVRYPWTPYGDMQLEVQKFESQVRVKAVMEELKEAMQRNKPVLGRVLNAVNGGYAVGIGGLVTFMPLSRASYSTVKKLGVLQPFHVLTLDETAMNAVVSDPYPRIRERRPRIVRGRL